MQEATADTVNDILRGVMEPGGFGQTLALDKPSAGKTGTIQNNAAVWFNGYTPELATAAMIAGANSQGQPDHAEQPERRRQLHRRRARLDGGRADVGARDARGAGRPPRRELRTSVRELATARSRSRSRTSPGCPRDGRLSGSPEPGSTSAPVNAGTPTSPAARWPRRNRARATARRVDRRSSSTRRRVADLPSPPAPSCARTDAATTPPSARPLVFGLSAPITRPMARMPSSRTPSSSMVAGDELVDLLLAELLGQVVGDHRGLGALLLRLLGRARRRRTPRRPRAASWTRW